MQREGPPLTIYSFYIFDRHTHEINGSLPLTDDAAECIYSKRWTPNAPNFNTHFPSGSNPHNSALPSSQRTSLLSNPSTLGTAASAHTAPSQSTTTTTTAAAASAAQHVALQQQQQMKKAADDAKLIFGAIFSLRRLVRQLGGADDQFLSYRTGEYKLHYYETPTQLKFIMLTDPRAAGAAAAGFSGGSMGMRTVLHQIWATLYVEYVVKSPLVPVEHPGGVGVANELFEGGLEGFLSSIFNMGPPPQA